MNEYMKCNLYGLDIETNVPFPVEIPIAQTSRIFEGKKILANCAKADINKTLYSIYSKNEHSNVIYMSNKGKDCSYIIETDKIGSVKVDANTINYYAPSGLTVEENNYAFLLSYGLALSMLLRLNNYAVLHASALKVQEKTVLIMGPSGVGKSTLCSYLIDRYSAQLISDDMSCIKTNDFQLYKGMPLMRLWPKTVSEVFDIDSAELTKVGKNGKVYLPISQFTEKTYHNVDFIIILEKSDFGPYIKQLSKNELVFSVYKNIYNRISLDNLRLKKEFDNIIKILSANQTKGFVLGTPRTFDALDKLVNMIITNVKTQN